jgi:hypothetical protein
MTDKRARVWNGSEWVNITSPIGVPNSIMVYQSEPPLSPVAGQVWVNSNDNYLGGYFVQSTNTKLSYLDTATGPIQDQLNNKEKSIPLQSTAPTSPSSSDLWVDNANPSSLVLKVYNGSSWVAISGGSSGSITPNDDQIVLAQRMFS